MASLKQWEGRGPADGPIKSKTQHSNMKLMTTPRSSLSYVSPFAPLFSRDLERLISGGVDQDGGYRPDLDVREDAKSVTVQVDLPGVRREDVQVTFHDGVLSIVGERQSDAVGKQDVRSYRERFFGRFERQLTIHSPINADQVRASHKDGILTVSLPKVEEVRPRQIEIATA